MNIRFKLSLQFLIIVVSILIFFSGSIYYFSAFYQRNDFYSRLENKALTTVKLLIEVKEVDSLLLKIIDSNTISSLHEEQVNIYNSSGTMLYESKDLNPVSYNSILLKQVKQNKSFRQRENNKWIVGFIFKDKHKDYLVIASAYDTVGEQRLKDLRIIIFAGLLFSFVLTFIAGLFYSGRALNPISNVIKQVEKIKASNLNLRVDEGNKKDEIAQLAITFNQMLTRIENAFESQRIFISNASHELRTPLTSITSQLEVTLMNKRDASEYESILQSILDDIKSLNILSNGLLDLAHSCSDITSIKYKQVRVDEVLLQAQTELIKTHPYYLINVNFEKLPEEENKLMILGSENLLKIVFLNLMDNACKFSQNTTVDIFINFNPQQLLIKIIDSGIGIPQEEISKIIEPFYRANNSKMHAGKGIGLSLVQKIIEMHKGKLIIDSKIDYGTLVTVVLPY